MKETLMLMACAICAMAIVIVVQTTAIIIML